jgi:catechol 2,3-dioxygenase-like lactoylglutathione lyase family enzyme
MNHELQDRRASGLDGFGFGPIDQISFAVTDMDRALPMYESLFGPFTRRRVTFRPDRVRYRGAPATATLLLAFGHTGDVEVELVAVEDGDAPSLEHLRDHGEGIHHIRFPVDDLDAKQAALEAVGFEEVLRGTTEGGAVFAYFEAPAALGHTLIELIQPAPADG